MPLDRNAVDKGAGEHIRRLQQMRGVSEKEKAKIRKMHERMARKVDVNKRH